MGKSMNTKLLEIVQVTVPIFFYFDVIWKMREVQPFFDIIWKICQNQFFDSFLAITTSFFRFHKNKKKLEQ